MQFCSSCVRKHCCLEHGFHGGSRLKFESLSARHLDTYSKLICNQLLIDTSIKMCLVILLGWHSGDCASFVMRNYQGFESLTQLQHSQHKNNASLFHNEYDREKLIRVAPKQFEFFLRNILRSRLVDKSHFPHKEESCE